MGNTVLSGYGATKLKAVENLNLVVLCHMKKELKRKTTSAGTLYYLQYGLHCDFVSWETKDVLNHTIYIASIDI